MKNKIIILLAAGTFVASAFAGEGRAFAQDSGSQTESAAIEEIVVTAQRRSERIEDVPVSIVSESAQQLQNANITSTMDLSRVVPGLLMSRVGAPSAPAIRGVSTKVVSPGSDANVATYLDGFYQANPVALNRTLLDVANVEVLRGPQGTLFGRNSTGGAILITTQKPSHDLILNVRAEVEENNGRRAAAYGSMGLSDKVAISVSGEISNSDGWLRNIAPNYVFPTAPTESRYIRGRILVEPADMLSIDASVEHGILQDGTATAFSFTAHPIVPGLFPNLSTSPIQTYLGQRNTVRDTWNAGYLTISWDLGWAVVKSLTQIYESASPWDFDLDGSPRVFIHVVANQDQHTKTEEVNLTSKGDNRLQWIAGAYYFHDNSEIRVQTFNSHYGNKTTSWAPYADATYRAVDKLFLTAGVRYTEERKDCLNALMPAGGGGDLSPCTVGVNPVNYEHSTTPRVVVRYELAPNTDVYASFSRGFKSGGFNDMKAVPYSPETISDWEIGFKTRRDRYRVELSGFHYDYKNLQFSYACTVVAPPTCLTAAGTVTTNAASATSYGGEAQFMWSATDQLSFNGGLAFLHARYDSFLNASATATLTATSTPACINPNPILCKNIAVAQDWSGQQLIRAPTWSGNLGFTGDLPTQVGTFELDLNASFVSRYQSDTDSLQCATTNCGRGLKPRLSIAPYTLVDMTLSWKPTGGAGKHFAMALYARNLLDRSTIIRTDASTVGDYVIGGEPRIVGGRFTYSY